MNYMKKFLSIFIPKDLSLAVIFVSLITCSCIVQKPFSFMVVKVLINVQTKDLLGIWERSFTKFINSLALSILGNIDLMLFAMLICINIRLTLIDLSQVYAGISLY